MDDKQKGKARKGKEGKVHKATSCLYFSNMGSRPR